MTSVPTILSTTPTPRPSSPASPIQPLHAIWHSLWHSLVTAYMASPALSVVATLILGAAAINAARTSYWRQTRRDPVRLFSRLDKALILGRASGRCEHHAAIFGRCKVTDKLEADHIHPHSRGGRTVISNGQALCHRHNQQKLAASHGFGGSDA